MFHTFATAIREAWLFDRAFAEVCRLCPDSGDPMRKTEEAFGGKIAKMPRRQRQRAEAGLRLLYRKIVIGGQTFDEALDAVGRLVRKREREERE